MISDRCLVPSLTTYAQPVWIQAKICQNAAAEAAWRDAHMTLENMHPGSAETAHCLASKSHSFEFEFVLRIWWLPGYQVHHLLSSFQFGHDAQPYNSLWLHREAILPDSRTQDTEKVDDVQWVSCRWAYKRIVCGRVSGNSIVAQSGQLN